MGPCESSQRENARVSAMLKCASEANAKGTLLMFV